MTNIRVGEPDISPDTPSHTPGTKMGNSSGSYRKSPGHKGDDKSTARRSTGILAHKKNTIVPGSPNISPP